jgi:predicted ATPase
VHLDGLPLAIELAAGRAKFDAPQTLLVRLGSRLEALNSGPRDLPARHRTLRSTLAWSYDLLDPAERVLFARLSVFAGGSTAEAARAVCAGTDDLQLDAEQGLESLLNKNLIRLLPPEVGRAMPPRFMMLETMREYALERLTESGHRDRLRARHAQYFLDLVERAAEDFRGPDEQARHRQLEAELDNLRAALRWSVETDQTGEAGLRFVASLNHFWETRGLLAEGRSWFTAVEQAASEPAPAWLRAKALAGTGDLAYLQCDYVATRALYEEALVIYEELGDQRGVAMSLIDLAEVATEVGDYATAPALFERAYAMTRTLGDPLASARALTQSGFGALRMGDLDRAHTWLAEGHAMYQSVEYGQGMALALSGLGEIAIRRGDLDLASRLLEESVALRSHLGHKWGTAASLGSLAWAEMLRGDRERAVRLLGESLALRLEIGDPGGMAWCLEKLAEMAWDSGDPARAARTLGAAQEMRARVSSVVDPSDQDHYGSLVSAVRGALGDDLYQALRGEGAAMSAEQAIAYALDLRPSQAGDRDSP